MDALKQDVRTTQETTGMRVGEKLEKLEKKCGLGGKVNTNPGKQNARVKGSRIYAARAIREGGEIFIPYGKNFRINSKNQKA